MKFIKAADAVKQLKTRKFGKLKYEAFDENRILVNWTRATLQETIDEKDQTTSKDGKPAKKNGDKKDPGQQVKKNDETDDKEAFEAFRAAVRRLDQPAGGREARNPTMRLYYLDAAKVAAALTDTVSDLTVKAVGDNQIVISGAKTLDEGDVEELKRRIALLDVPQPKVSMQVWGFQMSHEDPERVDKWFKKIKKVSNELNDGIQAAFQAGWSHIGDLVARQQLSEQGKDNSFPLETPLYRYVIRHFGDPDKAPQSQYGLGYGLYANAQPSLGKMLLVLSAAKDPKKEAEEVVRLMRESARKQCICEKNQGEKGASEKAESNQDKKNTEAFENFARALDKTFREYKVPESIAPSKKIRTGLPQAAIADFLFHHKWSVQYPHKFSPFLFSRSADELNAVLSPLIDAFNRDAEFCIQNALDAEGRKLPKGPKRNPWLAVFFNKKVRAGLAQSGMTRVATLSGSQAEVDGTSVSYFDTTSQAPTLSELIENKDAQVKALSGHLKGNPAQALGLLASLAIPTPTTVEIKRGMGIRLTPRTLPTGSGAEIDVAIGIGEGDAAPTQIGEGNNPHALDRVANHSVTTKVRVEAMKLFEVSTFMTTVHHPQPDGIVPVVGHAWNSLFGAVPGAGRLFKWRRRPAPMHHRSTALINAIVVPTPMDLVAGTRFKYDQEPNPDPWKQESKNKRERTVKRLTPPPHAFEFHQDFHECLIKSVKTGIDTECENIEFEIPVKVALSASGAVASAAAPTNPAQQTAAVRPPAVASQ